jgi:DNA invertase Pin-like site-specific DNA recombinase
MKQQKIAARDLKISGLTWSIPDGIGREPISTSNPKGTERATKRLQHMIALYEKGEKQSNIARLYKISRQRVAQLLKDHIKSKAL